MSWFDILRCPRCGLANLETHQTPDGLWGVWCETGEGFEYCDFSTVGFTSEQKAAEDLVICHVTGVAHQYRTRT